MTGRGAVGSDDKGVVFRSERGLRPRFRRGGIGGVFRDPPDDIRERLVPAGVIRDGVALEPRRRG